MRACGHLKPRVKGCVPCYQHLLYLAWKPANYAGYMKKRKKKAKEAALATK